MSAARSLVRSVEQARQRIFGVFPNPTNEMTGRKGLKKALFGKDFARYFEPYSLATFRNRHRHALWHMLSTGGERELMHAFQDMHENSLLTRLRRNKLPPAKGKGKRASRRK